MTQDANRRRFFKTAGAAAAGIALAEALAADKYLHKVPLDPITESATTWVPVPPPDPEKTGVYDVKSGAPGKALDGTDFSTW